MSTANFAILDYCSLISLNLTLALNHIHGECSAHIRHNRPIASHFHSGGLEFSYLGQDLDEADGESEETIARITVRERTAEHLHDVLSGD